ncbi:MAG: choice-of-anchor B family protein [Bacteroidetes bacterium]|nr:choice-of-anchor B family protein [Bacteroidota bacterium]
MLRYTVTFILIICFGLSSQAQTSLNVSLFGQLDPEPIHYAGCWGYTDSSGAEYALIGAYTGTSIIAIDDSLNIYEVDFVTGPSNNWREMTVINDFAYVVSEGSGTGSGMQVIDLSYLPDSVHLVMTFDSTFTTAHIISKDIDGDTNYVYVSGAGTTQGIHIIDISNPATPVEVSVYAPYYIHDCHIRGNRLYAAAFYLPSLDILDITNKANPQVIAKFTTSSSNIHSCWTTQDSKYIITTHELNGEPAYVLDIQDSLNIFVVAEYTANTTSLVHNPYIKGKYAYMTHNSEGLRILDLYDPTVPVEVGYYDTWAGASGGPNGLWSAFPFYSSGKIIGGNRGDGLYIWKFNGTRAGRIYGTVTDSITLNPINLVQIGITQTASSTETNSLGNYKIGDMASDTAGYDIIYSATGYKPKTLSNIILNQGDSLTMDVELVPLSWSNIEEPSSEKIKISPNPFSNYTRISIESGSPGLNLTVYNTLGAVVNFHSLPGQTPPGNHDTQEFLILKDDIGKGIFFFVITDGELVLYNGKLIIY